MYFSSYSFFILHSCFLPLVYFMEKMAPRNCSKV
nr:MAG TPA: hypothetical protein [Caudoviricetes sp.]